MQSVDEQLPIRIDHAVFFEVRDGRIVLESDLHFCAKCSPYARARLLESALR